MIAERTLRAASVALGVIALIDVLILIDKGFAGLDFSSFSPATIFAPGLGISVIYAMNGCIGFEATAIYQEEAKNRRAEYIIAIDDPTTKNVPFAPRWQRL